MGKVTTTAFILSAFTLHMHKNGTKIELHHYESSDKFLTPCQMDLLVGHNTDMLPGTTAFAT